jgi:hypothetical protein
LNEEKAMPDHNQIRDQIRKQVQEKLDRYGWTVIAVGPENKRPPFAYSVGFEKTFGTPEVVMIGFDPNLMQQLIGELASGMKGRGLKMPVEGGRMSKVIQKFDVLLRPVPDDVTYPLSKIAQNFQAPKTARLLQMVLPDPNGLFPGEEGCNPDYADFQNPVPFED